MQKTNVKKSNIRSQELVILGSSGILLMSLWRHFFFTLTVFGYLESRCLVNILSSTIEDVTMCKESSRSQERPLCFLKRHAEDREEKDYFQI